MMDFGFFRQSPLGCVNLDNVKSGLKRRRIHGKIILCGGSDSILLVPVHILHSLSKGAGFAELNLHKDQKLFIPYNQINLAEAASKAHRFNLIMLFSQKFCRQGLAPGAGNIISPHRIFSGNSSGEWRRGHADGGPRNAPWCRMPYVFQSRTGDNPWQLPTSNRPG